MKVIAISLVRDEQDVIGPVVEHLLAQGVDEVIVADNMSVDATPRILASLAVEHPVTILRDAEEAYLQAEKMNRLAATAREAGATWIVPFDADELWFGRPGGALLGEVLRASDDADVLVGRWFDHVAPPIALRPGRDVFARMSLRERAPHSQGKVAFRAIDGVVLLQGNHGVVGLDGLREVHGRLEVHHYRYRSFRHFVRKNTSGKRALDAAGDALEPGWGEHWRRHGARSPGRQLVSWVMTFLRAVGRGVVRDPVRPSRIPGGAPEARARAA